MAARRHGTRKSLLRRAGIWRLHRLSPSNDAEKLDGPSARAGPGAKNSLPSGNSPGTIGGRYRRACSFRPRGRILYHPVPAARRLAGLSAKGAMAMGYETILYSEDGPVGTLTLNRPEDGNMFTETMCHEVRDCINAVRRETRTRVLVITGAGDRFFCIGGRKTGMQDTTLYAGVLPTLDM